MAKKFKKAVITYNGGFSYQFRGKLFKQARPVKISDESLAKALDGKKDCSVQMEYVEVEDTPAAKPVKKPRKVAK